MTRSRLIAALALLPVPAVPAAYSDPAIGRTTRSYSAKYYGVNPQG